jgi:hypothetical protein
MNKQTTNELRNAIESAFAHFDAETKELIASLRECVARLERADKTLLELSGSVKDCELGEVTRARALLAKLES